MDKESVIKSKKANSSIKGRTKDFDKFSVTKQYDQDTHEKIYEEDLKNSGAESQDPKAKLVARVHTDSGYGFYDSQGKLALPEEYKLLKNDMYPDNKEFEYNFYLREENGIKHIYYIDMDGVRDLGEVVEAIPLREDLVAIKRNNDYPWWGIINKTGEMVFEDDQYGQILGISKDDCLVCKIDPLTLSIVTLDGIIHNDKTGFESYSVNPKSSLICGFDDYADTFSFWRSPADNRQKHHLDPEVTPIVYGDFVLGDTTPRYHVPYKALFLMNNHSFDIRSFYSGSEAKVNTWKYNILYYEDSAPDNWKHIDGSNNYYEGNPIMSGKFGVVWEIWESENNDYRYRIGKDKHTFDIIYFLFNRNNANFFIGTHANAHSLGIWKCSQKLELVKELYACQEEEELEIDAVSSVGEKVFIHFIVSQGRHTSNYHTLIIDKNGDVIFQDHFGVYNFICGPFDNRYYFLKEGDLYWKLEGVREGYPITENLQAEKLFPLGETGRFLVVINGKYQIIDCHGNKLGEPFADFCLPSVDNQDDILPLVMDYILNSKYLPIKNDDGMHGLIDIRGNFIVPCKYPEIKDADAVVEDINSVFKREGIVLF